jgi:3-deoxy-7-phosphoheptulonate synthase
MAQAAIAGGADGIMIEVHHRPDASISDAPQAIDPEAFAALMDSLRRVAGALDRSFE